eukprot:COSAG02_NODE_715_length_18086_cov_109.753433_10_plen_70_part_00
MVMIPKENQGKDASVISTEILDDKESQMNQILRCGKLVLCVEHKYESEQVCTLTRLKVSTGAVPDGSIC